MKALLLHIGIDTSNWFTAQIDAPVFDDGCFEFIPIVEHWREVSHSASRGWYVRRKHEGQHVVEKRGESEERGIWTSETRTYSEASATNKEYGRTLADYVPFEYHDVIMHYDPDFTNCTYADQICDSRGKQIIKLDPNDYIFFVQSLAPFTHETYSIKTAERIAQFQKGLMAKCIVGYFKVHDSYHIMRDESAMTIISSFEDVTDKLDSDLSERINRNVHSKRDEDDYFIVVGEKSQSMLLRKAIRITERGSPFHPNATGFKIYGDKCFPRGFKWICNETIIDILLDLCRSGV